MTSQPFASQRLLLGQALVTLQALSAQGLGAMPIYPMDSATSVGLTPLGDTVAWPMADYNAVGAAWTSVTSDPAFGGSTAITIGTPLALTVDGAAADIAAMNAWLDAYQGPVSSGFPWVTAGLVLAGAAAAYGLWRAAR